MSTEQQILVSTFMAVAESFGKPLSAQCDFIDQVVKDAKDQVTQVVELANRFRKHRGGEILKISDVKDAVSARKLPPLFGYHSAFRTHEYIHAGQAGGGDVYALDELDNVGETWTSRVPEYPTEITFKFHWLAVDGVQPRVPENQSEHVPESVGLLGMPEEREWPEQNVSIVSSNVPLSKSQRDFLDQMASDLRPENLEQLQKYPAMQPLVPYLLRIVIARLKNGEPIQLRFAMKITASMFRNETLQLEPYIQNFVGVALSVILFEEPESLEDPDEFGEQYELRESGVDLLSMIRTKFQDKCPEMWNQIAEGLLDVILCPVIKSSQYGAVIAFQVLGADMIKQHLLPNMVPFLERVQSGMESRDVHMRITASRIHGACSQVCGSVFNLQYARGDGHVRLDRQTADLYDSIAKFFGYSTFSLFAPQRRH